MGDDEYEEYDDDWFRIMAGDVPGTPLHVDFLPRDGAVLAAARNRGILTVGVIGRGRGSLRLRPVPSRRRRAVVWRRGTARSLDRDRCRGPRR
jgi:hypothetical protein